MSNKGSLINNLSLKLIKSIKTQLDKILTKFNIFNPFSTLYGKFLLCFKIDLKSNQIICIFQKIITIKYNF